MLDLPSSGVLVREDLNWWLSRLTMTFMLGSIISFQFETLWYSQILKAFLDDEVVLIEKGPCFEMRLAIATNDTSVLALLISGSHDLNRNGSSAPICRHNSPPLRWEMCLRD